MSMNKPSQCHVCHLCAICVPSVCLKVCAQAVEKLAGCSHLLPFILLTTRLRDLLGAVVSWRLCHLRDTVSMTEEGGHARFTDEGMR